MNSYRKTIEILLFAHGNANPKKIANKLGGNVLVRILSKLEVSKPMKAPGYHVVINEN